MPGLNCCIPGCTNYQKKGGKSVFKIIKATDDWSKDWRSKVVSIVLKYRVVDSDFKRQLDGNNVAICEDHYEEDCLLHHSTRTTLKPGSLPSKNFPSKSIPEVTKKSRDSITSIELKRAQFVDIRKPSPTKPYSSIQDLNKKIASLKLHSFKSEFLPTYTRLFKTTDDHVIPFIEIFIKSDLSFIIRMFSWKLPIFHEIYSQSLESITVSTLISLIEQFSICSGISSSFSSTNVVTHIVPRVFDPLSSDETSPVNQDVFYRSKNCMVLAKNSICSSCSKCQPIVLKAAKRKNLKSIEPAKDKAPISLTSPARIQSKLHVLNAKCNELTTMNKCLNNQVSTLQADLKSVLDTAKNVKVTNDLDSDLKTIFKNSKDIPPFMELFWSEQMNYQKSSSSKGIRYHPSIIKYCLSLVARSPAAYDQIRYDENNGSGILVLPSRRLLRNYKNYITPQRGFNKEIIKELISKTQSFSDFEKHVIVAMDEMKIQENLVWDKHSHELIGFIDLGDPNLNLATLKDSQQKKLASHVLVFLVQSLMNPFKFSLANFGTDSILAEQIFPLFWKAHTILEKKCDLKVMGVTGDGATQNRKFFRMVGSMNGVSDPVDVTYRVENPFDSSRYIYLFSDPPHLLKTLRNSLYSSKHGSKTRYLWNDGYHILWNHVSDMFYEDLDCGLHLMPRVTLQHINLTSYSKMNVRLAAQILSSTVSNVLKEFGPRDAVGTAKFCELVNKFFDCLNVRVPNMIQKVDEDGNIINKTRNEFVEPFKKNYDFRFSWLKNDFLKYFEDWIFSIETRPGNFSRDERAKMFIAKPTYEGIKITTNSTVELVQYLLTIGFPYVLTGRFIQDSLENYFSMQRACGRRKDNPSLYDFGYNDNMIRNSKSFQPVGTNCEVDNEDEQLLPLKKSKQ